MIVSACIPGTLYRVGHRCCIPVLLRHIGPSSGGKYLLASAHTKGGLHTFLHSKQPVDLFGILANCAGRLSHLFSVWRPRHSRDVPYV